MGNRRYSPAVGLPIAFNVDPLLAGGVMLLAASPGGPTANLFSHLFRGDVALNITLTAVNSVLAAFTVPVITNLTTGLFCVASLTLGYLGARALRLVADRWSRRRRGPGRPGLRTSSRAFCVDSSPWA